VRIRSTDIGPANIQFAPTISRRSSDRSSFVARTSRGRSLHLHCGSRRFESPGPFARRIGSPNAVTMFCTAVSAAVYPSHSSPDGHARPQPRLARNGQSVPRTPALFRFEPTLRPPHCECLRARGRSLSSDRDPPPWAGLVPCSGARKLEQVAGLSLGEPVSLWEPGAGTAPGSRRRCKEVAGPGGQSRCMFSL
jgi:hypothetical protein